MRTVFALALSAAFVCVFGSCSKKVPLDTPPDIVSEPAPIACGAPVAVLFAYGYNDATFLAETKALIQERFSRDDESVSVDAIMMPLIFPDDFPSRYTARLYEKINNANLSAFVLLGSPEGTYKTLAGLRDDWDKSGGAIPVVSLFSQDDVLGTEAESDVAVDFAPLPETPALADATEEAAALRRIPPDTLVQILTELHRRAVASQGADSPDADANSIALNTPETTVSQDTIVALFGPGYLVTPYHDAETGLIAANHFLVDFGGAP
jgi:hypothetical protein